MSKQFERASTPTSSFCLDGTALVGCSFCFALVLSSPGAGGALYRARTAGGGNSQLPTLATNNERPKNNEPLLCLLSVPHMIPYVQVAKTAAVVLYFYLVFVVVRCSRLFLLLPHAARGRLDSRRLGAISDPSKGGHAVQLSDAQEPAVLVAFSALREASRTPERRSRLLFHGRVAKRGHSRNSFSPGEFLIER